MTWLSSSDDELAARLRGLPREVPPPPGLIESILAARRSERRRSSNWIWNATVAASLVMAAFALGRTSAPTPTAGTGEGQEYIFLLYGGPTGQDDSSRVGEYGRWAQSLAKQGTPVSGERLADRAVSVGPAREANALVRGYFIVRAPDEASALQMATGHPHAVDGTIEVRQIDTPRR